MRIGVSLADPTGPDPLTALAGQIREAAGDGFSSAWISNIFGLDALTALAVAGRDVPGIELGTAVVPSYPRHPAVMAQQAITASVALGGRLTLGIGLSHKIVIDDMYGYSFDRPARHMREYLAVLAPLLRGEPVNVTGETVRASIALTVPGHSGRVPLLLAALAPAMLKLAATQADGTVLWMTGPATVRDYVVPALAAAARDAGRPDPGRPDLRDLRPAAVLPGHARPGGRRRARGRGHGRRRGHCPRPDRGPGGGRGHRLRSPRLQSRRRRAADPRPAEVLYPLSPQARCRSARLASLTRAPRPSSAASSRSAVSICSQSA